MKIALSASFFNCPAIAEILHSCDIVFTTNPYALEHFAHKDIRAESTRLPITYPADSEIVTFTHLFKEFNKWVAEVATDEELCDWAGYFGTGNFQRMRDRALGAITIPTPEKMVDTTPTTSNEC